MKCAKNSSGEADITPLSDKAGEILRRLRREINGAVAGAMEERGILYPLNYGVSVPTIKIIAADYAPDHDLAAELFASGTRELMLAALFIDDPAEVTVGQMESWSESFSNPEIAENCAARLFCNASQAPATALLWMDAPQRLKCYAGILMASRIVRSPKKPPEALIRKYISGTVSVTEREDFDMALSMAVASLLEGCMLLGKEFKESAEELSSQFKISDNPLVKHTAQELSWRIESSN